MTIQQLADKYIPASNGKKIFKKDGKTDDIIAEVIAAYKDSREQLNQFAPHLKGASLRDTLFNVWKFWKFNIRYKKDPDGEQLVQEPKALWARKEGDCKSLSIAVMTTLDALDIKASFRFTAYGMNTEFPTHVYVVVMNNGSVIPVDCVWKEFGTQKPFSKNWDYNMTSISRLSGIDEQPIEGLFDNLQKMRAAGKLKHKKGFINHVKAGKRQVKVKPFKSLFKRGQLNLPADKEVTPPVMDMLLKKQRLELEQKAHATINGTDNTYNHAYELQIMGIHNALADDMGWERLYPVRYDSVSGIGEINQTDYETVEAIEGFFGSIFKGIKNIGKAIGKGVKAVGKGIGKGVKAVSKVVAAPFKAVAKLAMKVITGPARTAITNQLPQTAPFFLYLFITDPKLLAKLPPVVATKRNKAIEYKKLITGKLQMSESNFTGAVRNGIMLQFNASPEDVIAKWIKDTNFQVGFLSSIIGAAGGLLKGLLGNMGDGLEADAQQYAPAIEDWGTVTEAAKTDLANEASAQPSNLMYNPMSQQQLQNTMQTWQQQQPMYQPGYSGNAYLDQPATGTEYRGTDGGGDNPDSGSGLDNFKLGQNAVVKGVRKKSPVEEVPQEQSGGTGMLIGLGVLAVVAMASGKKKKAS